MTAESLTGNVMVVYTNNSNNPSYRYFNGSSWSAEATVPTSSTLSGTSEWIVLKSKPGSNEITLAYADSNSDLATLRWDGTQWVSNSNKIITGRLRERNQQCFDIAYESLSGDLLVCYGYADSNGIRYTTFDNDTATWSGNSIYAYLYDNSAKEMNLASDPTTDSIAILLRSNGGYLEGAVWGGEGMSDGERIDYIAYDSSNNGDSQIDLSFVGTTGNVIGVYDDYNSVGVLNWVQWIPGSGWSIKTDITIPTIQNIESVQMSSMTDRNEILVLNSDSSSSLYASLYDGVTWTNLNNSDPIQSELSRLDGVPFSMATKESTRIILSNSTQGQKDNQLTSTGSLPNKELFSFQLKPLQGSGNTIDSVVFDLHSIEGLIQSEMNTAEIYIDENNNGSVDGGEATVGGAGNIYINGPTGNVAFTTSFTVSSANNYILRASFSNVADGDILSITLNSSGINPEGSLLAVGSTQDSLHSVSNIDPDSVGDLRLAYGTSASPSNEPKIRVWRESTDSYTSESTSAAADGPIYWIEGAKSPINNHEVLLTLAADGSNLEVDLIQYDGTTWSSNWTDTAINIDQSYRMYGDITYESISGNAIAVYSNWNSDIKYRHFDASTNIWGAETSVFSSTPIGGTVQWVRVEPQPGTNRIAMAYHTSNRDLAACIWDGDTNTWLETETEVDLDDNSENFELRTFDIAFESISGDLLVAWGHRDSDGIYFATMDFGTNTWVTGGRYTYRDDEEARFLDLSPDPYSDKIAAGLYAEGGRLQLAMWTGDAFSEGIYRDYMYPGTWERASYSVSVGWIGSTGQAICVFMDGSNGTNNTEIIRWLYWTQASNGWQWKSSVNVPNMDRINSIKLISKYDEDVAMAIISDRSGQLYSAETDGSSWTIHNDGEPIATNLYTTEAIPFDFYLNKPPIAIARDHIAGQVANALTSGTSVADTALFSFNLRQDSGRNITIDNLVFDLSNISGIYSHEVTDLQIFYDKNNNGSLDAEDTEAVGGTGTITINGASGNIAFSTNILVSSANNYILRGDIGSLVANDQISIQLNRDGITAAGEGIGIGSTTPAAHFQGDTSLDSTGEARLIYASTSTPGGAPKTRLFQMTTMNGLQKPRPSLMVSPFTLLNTRYLQPM